MIGSMSLFPDTKIRMPQDNCIVLLECISVTKIKNGTKWVEDFYTVDWINCWHFILEQEEQEFACRSVQQKTEDHISILLKCCQEVDESPSIKLTSFKLIPYSNGYWQFLIQVKYFFVILITL